MDRVVLIHILPGHFDAFMADIKTNVIPIWEAQKKAGLILELRDVPEHNALEPDEWDFGYELTYKNMAALDGLA